MSTTALINVRIVTEDSVIDSGYVIIDGENIISVGSGQPEAAADAQLDLKGDILAPGYIDMQVNGGGDVLFNDAPTVESIETIAGVHRRYGVTRILPTLISDDLSTIKQGLRAVEEAIARGVPGVAGLHVEGPFLNAKKRGIHSLDKIQPLTADAIDVLSSAKRAIVVLTIAPECVDVRQIQELAQNGVRLSAGHTDATYEETRSVLKAGVTCFTHLFNAMSPLQSRAPGVICSALESNAWCGIIVDGKHVHPAMLRMALRAKTDRRFLLVSDAMPTAGGDLDHFYIADRRIRFVDGALRAEDGTLAGAALNMSLAVRNAVEMLEIDLEEAVRFASLNPATFLGVSADTGSIRVGKRADFAVLSANLEPMETWIAGVRYVS